MIGQIRQIGQKIIFFRLFGFLCNLGFLTFLIINGFFIQFSKHQPSGPRLPISQNVRLCVRMCVCLCVCSLFEVPFKCLLPPLPETGCP